MPQHGIIDDNLRNVLLHLRQLKADNAEARSRSEQVANLRPDTSVWSGDLASQQGFIEIHKAFNTDKAEEALIRTHDATNPGNAGDDIALPLQIDYAAQMERAYRARTTMPFPRMLAHVTARERGHGMPRGILAFGLLRYAESVLQRAATSDGGSL